MSFRRVIALAVALGLAPGCAFDPSGSGIEPGSDGTPRSDPDASIPPAPPDAAGPDAMACVDTDGDGFLQPNFPGAICEPVDCDDEDEDVYPGQTGAFTAPKSSGDYDYNCDGVDEKLSDTQRGEGCHEDIFGPCLGTGWLDAVPDCGQLGTWHRCEDSLFGCDEAERIDAVMPCH